MRLERGAGETWLTGEIADQAQLQGLLARVADLGLALRSFGPVPPEPEGCARARGTRPNGRPARRHLGDEMTSKSSGKPGSARRGAERGRGPSGCGARGRLEAHNAVRRRVDRPALGPPGRPGRRGQGCPEARAPRQPRGLRARARAATRSRILEAQEADRLPNLVPLRHERMAESAFAYYRGTPAVMAFDLAGTPTLGHRGPGQRRRPPVQLRPVRLPRADARLRRQRLRRDAARALGVGRQAAGREHGDLGPGERVQRREEPRGGDGRRPRLPAVDRPLRRHAPDRRLVRVDHRR